MTDLLITDVGDAWVHSGREGLNTGSAAWVQVKSGERRALVRPPLQSLAGRTVLNATLVGRVGPDHVAQTYTLAAVTSRWSPGRVTWANQPTITGVGTVSEVVSALPDKGLVEFDVTGLISAVAAGTEWFGFQITTDSSADGQKFYATDSGLPAWELHVSLSDAPEQPSNLRPNAGAVTTATPILAWDFVDLGGTSTEQAEFEIQVDTPAVDAEPDDVSPDYYLTWTAGSDPEFDLSVSPYTPVGAGPHYWRVRTGDTAGEQSEWSDWADFTVADLPTVVIDSPVGAFGDPSPTVAAHTVEGDPVTWRVWVTGPDRADIRAESGVQSGAISWEVPERNADNRRVLVEDEQCWIHLRVWDSVDRAIAVGEVPFVDTWIAAEFDDDLSMVAPSQLTVVQPDEDSPRLLWTWKRSEAAEAWLLQDGDVTLVKVDAADVTASGGFYSYLDNGHVSPLRPHRLKVRAVEDDNRSTAASTPVEHSFVVNGVWLLPEGEDPIVLDGTTVGDFVRTDRSAIYTPLVGPPVEVIYDYTGRSGSFMGSIDSRLEDLWGTVAQLEALAASRNRVVRMVWGSHSISVRLSDLDVNAAEDITETNLRHNVRFRFVQIGD